MIITYLIIMSSKILFLFKFSIFFSLKCSSILYQNANARYISFVLIRPNL